MEGTREGRGFFCSPKLPYLSAMSQQFCHRLYTSRFDTSCFDTSRFDTGHFNTSFQGVNSFTYLA